MRGRDWKDRPSAALAKGGERAVIRSRRGEETSSSCAGPLAAPLYRGLWADHSTLPSLSFLIGTM